jgi:hypothetical protein
MSIRGGIRSFHFVEYCPIILLAITLSVLMHARSFLTIHREGDEIVYLSLSREMNWDLSHYTTQDDANVSKYPGSIYRSSLFHHPPVFPLMLKLGTALFSDPVFMGLLCENVAIWLLLYYAWRWMVFQQMPVAWGTVAVVGVTFCPLLLSSSVMLHHDCLMGCLMAAGLVAYIEALQQPTLMRAVVAAVLLCLGFNVRYNALIFIPVLVALPIYDFRCFPRAQAISGSSSKKKISRTDPRWRVCAIVFATLIVVGFQHYYRVLWAYGSLMPSRFLQIDPDAAEFSPFLRAVLEAKPWKTVLNLVLIYPILLSFLLPPIYAPVVRALRAGSREVLFVPVFLYLLAVELYFSYSQLRYFATVTPCLFLGLPYLIREQSARYRTIMSGLAAVSLMQMLATGFLKTQISPPGTMAIIPAIYVYLPMLQPLL